jgi:type VI protein secretion system component Hcp
MDQNKTDLVMRFVLEGQPVWAECVLDVWKHDDLMKDFKSADYDSYSNFFEIKTFDFSIALKEDDESTNVIGQQAKTPASTAKPAAGAGGAFTHWRSATNSEYKKIHYPLEFDKFSFSRVIDSASPVFFQSCCKSQTFDRAVLVKRMSQGSNDGSGATRPTVGYLRIDFTEVLITGIDWDDGDMVEEKCEFICRGMTLTYRKQKDDGTVDASSGKVPAVWPNPHKDRSLGIRTGGRRN